MSETETTKKYRMYSEDEEKFVGKQTYEMTEKDAERRNGAMPKWSTLRWKEVTK